MFFKLLTNVIIWVYDRVKSITSKPDYKIIDQSMEYFINNNIIPEELDDFWMDESLEWDGITETFYNPNNNSNMVVMVMAINGRNTTSHAISPNPRLHNILSAIVIMQVLNSFKNAVL